MDQNKELVEYLKREYGNDLRSVVEYDGDVNKRFVRDDLREEEADGKLGIRVNEIASREVDDVMGEVGRDYLEELLPFGERKFSIEIFEKGVLLMMVLSKDRMVLASIEGSPEIDVESLINTCSE